MSHFLGTPARSRLWWMSMAGKHADEAKKTRERLLSGPMVDIYVGKERKRWSLHRNLLCHHSPYFEIELVGHEVPKKQNADGNNKLELPKDDPRGFELFVKWLYQGQLDDVSELENDEKYEYAVACQKLYLLSSKFSMPHLSNLAIDAYRQNLNAAHLVPDADEINEIYRSSPPRSPFRTLMTRIAARQIMDPEIDKDAETYRAAFENNPDFAVEMVNAIRYMSGGMLFENPTGGKDCDWHEHVGVGSCQSRKAVKGKGRASVPYMNGVSGSQIEGTTGKRIISPTMTRVRDTPLAELPVDKRTPRKLHLPPQQFAAKPGAQQTSTTHGKGRKPSTPLQNATGVSPSPTKPMSGKPRPVLGRRASSFNKNVANAGRTPPRKIVSANASPVKLEHRQTEDASGSPPKPPANSPAYTNGISQHSVNGYNTSPQKTSPVKQNARRAVSGPAQMNGLPNGKFDVERRPTGSEGPAPKKMSSEQVQKSQVDGTVRQLDGAENSRSTNGNGKAQANGTALDGFGVLRAGAPSEAGTTTTATTDRSVADTTSGSSEGLDRRDAVKLKRKVPG